MRPPSGDGGYPTRQWRCRTKYRPRIKGSFRHLRFAPQSWQQSISKRLTGCSMHFSPTSPALARGKPRVRGSLLDMAEEGQWENEILRLWQPASTFVVMGRGSRVAEEVNLAATAAANVLCCVEPAGVQPSWLAQLLDVRRGCILTKNFRTSACSIMRTKLLCKRYYQLWNRWFPI